MVFSQEGLSLASPCAQRSPSSIRRRLPESSVPDKTRLSPPVRRSSHPPIRNTASPSLGDEIITVSNLGAEERKLVERERSTLRVVLQEFNDRCKDVSEKVEALVRRADQEEPGPRDEGASFLGAKQTLLLSYCRELCAYAACKGRGQALHGGGAAGRLVDIRAIMEKVRPLDRKLKYQTDKLLRLAASAPEQTSNGGRNNDVGDDDESTQDPLSFRPRPEAMAPWGSDAGGLDTDSKASKASMSSGGGDNETGLYRAPRLASVPYDEDGQRVGADKEERRLQKRRERLRRGEVMETLREEFGEQPETVRAVGNAGATGVSEAKMKRLLDEDKERRAFEEDHMVRLTMTRKAKKARKQIEKDAERLETIADVGSAADFVRVARDADGWGGKFGGDEDESLGGGEGFDRKKAKSGGALRRAMGAVGSNLNGSGASRRKSRGGKQRR